MDLFDPSLRNSTVTEGQVLTIRPFVLQEMHTLLEWANGETCLDKKTLEGNSGTGHLQEQ